MKKILSIIILIVLLVVVAMMFFGVKKQKEQVVKITERERVSEEQQVESRDSITVKHQFRNGMHTYVGSIDIPSPCHTAEISTQYNSEDNSVLVDMVVKPPVADAVCAQVITPTPFEITFDAPENAEVFFMLNGDMLIVNQYEVPPAQNIDSVDLYFKG